MTDIKVCHLWRPPMETTHGDPWRPVETTLVSHLPCPLPPNQSVIHLPCPLPPNQSVICLAPCHQTTRGDLWRPTETHRDHPQRPVETHGDHPWRPPKETCKDHLWRPAVETHRDLWRPSVEITCGDPQRPPAETTLVSHLPCPLPPNQSVICLAPCHQTTHGDLWRPPTETHRHLKFDWSIFPTTFNDIIGTDFDWLISPPQPIRSFGLNNLINIKSWVFFPTTSLKSLRRTKIDELADSNEPAKIDRVLQILCHRNNTDWYPWQYCTYKCGRP